MNDTQRLKEAIIMTASYYRCTIDPGVLNMYVEDLEDLNTDHVIQAYKSYRRDPKNRAFPLPAQIRGIVQPEPTNEVVAREILNRINIAIPKFGYMRLLEAKEFIGDIGWRLVDSSGGWSRLCESDFIHNEIAQAQARTRLTDLAQYGSNVISLALAKRENVEHQDQEQIDLERQRQLQGLLDHANKNKEMP